jgi:hypothetical protein
MQSKDYQRKEKKAGIYLREDLIRVIDIANRGSLQIRVRIVTELKITTLLVTYTPKSSNCIILRESDRHLKITTQSYRNRIHDILLNMRRE